MLLDLFGFEDVFNSSDAGKYGTGRYGSSDLGVYQSTSGRNGWGLGMSASNASNGFRKNYGAGIPDFIWGQAVRYRGTLAANGHIFRKFLDVQAAAMLSLRINNNGTISLLRGTTVLGTTTSVLANNTWAYVEVKVVLHGSTGSFVLRYNEAIEASGSGINTTNTGRTELSMHDLCNDVSGSTGTLAAVDHDDCYLADSRGGSPWNDFLGDCAVVCLRPNGTIQGQASRTAGSGASYTANHQVVDDPGFATLDFLRGVGNTKDIYSLADFAPDRRIWGVKPWAHMQRNTSSGFPARPMRIGLGTNNIHTVAPPGVALYIGRVFMTNADDSDREWTRDSLSATTYFWETASTPPPPPSAPHWRIAVYTVNSTFNNIHLTEIQMATSLGGANVCTGGTPWANRDNWYAIAGAFDGSFANLSRWGAETLPGVTPPYFGQYKFASNVSIEELRLSLPDESWAPNDAPNNFTLQYSLDGFNFYDAWFPSNQTGWTRNSTRTFQNTGGSANTWMNECGVEVLYSTNQLGGSGATRRPHRMLAAM